MTDVYLIQDNLNEQDLWKRFKKVFPMNEAFLPYIDNEFSQGLFPRFIRDANQSHIIDSDGIEYIDYCMGGGTMLLGYKYPTIQNAITQQLNKPIHSTLISPLHIEVAEWFQQYIPSAESVVFGKSGSDACSAAVRLARMVTGREKVIHWGHHGSHDWYLASQRDCQGIPASWREHIYDFQYNDISSVQKLFTDHPKQIAAVILDPVTWDLPQDQFLQMLERITHENGALLIFDENVTGFRVALGGAQEYFDVHPDLSCFSKCFTGGMPLAVLVGKKHLMKDIVNIRYGPTFYNETLSMAAAKAGLTSIKDCKAWKIVDEKGTFLRQAYNRLAGKYGLKSELSGLSCRLYTRFYDMNGIPEIKIRTLFLQELARQKILTVGIIFPCISHTEEDLEKTVHAFDIALGSAQKAIEKGTIDDYLQVRFRKTLASPELSSHPVNGNSPWKSFYHSWKNIFQSFTKS